MKPDNILQADVLDIIFKNRNKSYGAYSLRKHYNERLYKALGFTFLIISCFYVLSFIHLKRTVLLNVIPDTSFGNPVTIPEKPLEPKLPEKPKVPSIKPRVNADVFVSTLVITKDETTATKLSENLDSVAIDSKTVTGVMPGGSVVKMLESNGGSTSGNLVTKSIDKESPLRTAEIMPAYPGGMDALRKFLQQHLQNPQGLDEGQAVSVKIRFVVGYDGNLKGFETVEDGGKAFNNEVIRVLKKMPAWIPGKSSGENVSVYYTIPVKFVAE
ncbi:MAG: energy transducer TonB [Ferruginibacter sp.]